MTCVNVIVRRLGRRKLGMPVEPLSYQGTNTFVNKLGIRGQRELLGAESDCVSIRVDQYRRSPIDGDFNLWHLQVIHFHLFQDVYAWAGRLRSYNVKKGESYFCPAKNLKYELNKLFRQLKDEHWLGGLNSDQFVARLAHYYSSINKIHPFPEGNGRTQRLFIEHLAASNQFRVKWTEVHQWEINETAIQSFSNRNDRLAPTIAMLKRVVANLDEENTNC